MATIGVLGGGQLGRMLALDAQANGHRVVVRTDEDADGPAELVAWRTVRGAYDDADANATFLKQLDAITCEFENLPAPLLRAMPRALMAPSADAVFVCQHRLREKEFLRDAGIPHAAFFVARSADDLATAVRAFDGAAVAKTSAFGYDGKGQVHCRPGAPFDAERAWNLLAPEAVVEQFVPFVAELSVVGVRSRDGAWVPFAPGRNVHANGILDYTVVPADINDQVAVAAQNLAGRVAAALDYVGVLGVELFLLDDGSLVVNEIAPRPHNSGHHTIDACVTSQFGQQWRAAIGEAPGDPSLTTSAVMLNLLGDRWANGEPSWDRLAEAGENACLHLYGKATPRAGRKMGHLTVLGLTVEAALALREDLTRS